MSDPKVIYLGPACEANTGDGRTWAEDWPWPDCECGHQPVQYVLGETFSRMKGARDALQLDLNQRDEQIATLESQREAWLRNSQAAERRVEVLEADKRTMAEAYILYTWLRKKCDQPSNDVVVVNMNIGHDWVPVQDLDRDLRTMIDREEP